MFRDLECQVLDYQTQQLQLLPLLASAYVFKQVGYYIMKQNDAIETEIAAGKLDKMQEVSLSVTLEALILLDTHSV